MSKPVQIPGGYVALIAATATPNHGRFYIPRDAVVIATDNRAWVNPFAQPEGSPVTNSWLCVERIADGFRLDLSVKSDTYVLKATIGGEPEPIKQVPWIPIVEVVTSKFLVTAEGTTNREPQPVDDQPSV